MSDQLIPARKAASTCWSSRESTSSRREAIAWRPSRGLVVSLADAVRSVLLMVSNLAC